MRGFPTNRVLKGERRSLHIFVVCSCVCVCVEDMTAAPWTSANVMSMGFLKAGSLSCALREALRRVTFTTTGASGACHPFSESFIHSGLV